MGLTPNRGYTTTDAGGADATEKRNITFDKQFGSGSTSNVMKIDADIHNLNAELDQANLDISKLKDKSKHPIPTVSATYVETIDEVDYYEATSDEITELYDKLIILLQLDSVNSGIINLKINSLTGVKLKKNSDGTLTDLLSNDLNVNTVYSFQYNGSAFCCIGNLNASDIKQTAIPGAETVDEAFSSIAVSLDNKAQKDTPVLNGPVTINAAGDKATSLILNTERPWRFRQSGSAGNAGLDLASDSAAKTFRICTEDESTGIMLRLESTKHNAYLMPMLNKIYNLGGSSNSWTNIYSETALIITSDERQKENIEPLDPDKSAAFVAALNPVQYKFKDGTRPHYGLISQEVARAMKDCGIDDFAGFIKSPIEDEDGKITGHIYGLRYEEFIPLLLNVVQDQQKRIEALENKV